MSARPHPMHPYVMPTDFKGGVELLRDVLVDITRAGAASTEPGDEATVEASLVGGGAMSAPGGGGFVTESPLAHQCPSSGYCWECDDEANGDAGRPFEEDDE